MNLPFGFTLEANFNGLGLLFWGLFLVTTLFTIYNNRGKTNSGTSVKYQLWFIISLRTVSIFSLLLLAFNPEVKLTRSYSAPKRIAVLVDQSRSMGKAWEGNTVELNRSIEGMISNLSGSHSIDVWNMDGNAIESYEFEFDGDISILSWEPGTENSNSEGVDYSSVILISDGHINGGRSPLDESWTATLPIYPFMPLAPKSNQSLKMLRSGYEYSKSSRESILVDLEIQQSGLMGRLAIVQIGTENNPVLIERKLPLRSSITPLEIPLSIVELDRNKLKLSVSLENGELMSESYLNVESEDPKKSVLIVSERVNQLHKFLIRSFSDSLFQVHTRLGTTDEKHRTSLDTLIGKVDLTILNSPGSKVFTPDLMNVMRDQRNDNLPVILFQGAGEPLDALLSETLNLRITDNLNSPEEVTAYWAEDALDHPFYLGLLGREYKPVELTRFAPLKRGPGISCLHGAEMLASGSPGTRQPVMTLVDKPPLAIFGGSGYWRWFFHPQSKESFEQLWEYLLVYLNEISDFEPVKIEIPLAASTTGSPIQATINIKDLDHRRIHAAELRTWQENSKGQKVALDLNREGTGEYTSWINTVSPGDFSVIAEAYRFGELWGRDTSRISLMSFNGEDQSRGVDEHFLSRLASRSGGEIIAVNDDLPMFPVELVEKQSSSAFKGLRSVLLFGLLLASLMIEWILRRRNGLL